MNYADDGYDLHQFDMTESGTGNRWVIREKTLIKGTSD